MGFFDDLVNGLDKIEKTVVMLDDKLNAGVAKAEKGVEKAEQTLQKIDETGHKAIAMVRPKENDKPETD